jgi:SAM-dependent methyltransferase
MTPPPARSESFGQSWSPTLIDRLGIWLSARKIKGCLGTMEGKALADLGCGFHATFSRSFLDRVESLTLVDLAISPDVAALPKVSTIHGRLPDDLEKLPDGSFDGIIFNNVLEHLDEPLDALTQIYRMLKFGGTVFVNVPSWRGKVFWNFLPTGLGLVRPKKWTITRCITTLKTFGPCS